MKFAVPLALFAAALVTAQDEDCEANYIVATCFSSESKKLEDCSTSDYDCLCRASEALATCFNNCPNDPRGETYRSQILIHCANASIHGTAAKATPTTASGTTSNTAPAEADVTTSDSASPTSSSEEEEEAAASASGAEASANADSGVGHLARNTAGVLLAVAGAVAAML